MKKRFLLLMGMIMLGFFGLQQIFKIDIGQVNTFVLGYGVLSVFIIYILIYVTTLTEAMPSFLMQIGAGVLLGTFLGGVVNIAGVLTAEMTLFYLAWRGKKFAHKDLKKAKKHIEKDYVKTLFLTRLIPVIPNNVLSIAAGMHKVKPSEFLLIMVIGNLPYAFLAAALGDTLTQPFNILLVALAVCTSALLSTIILRAHFQHILQVKKLALLRV